MFEEFNMQDYRKRLDALSSVVLKAYLDAAMFVIIVPIANDKRKTSNFLFDYSYYTIRERAIIAAKSIIEPKGTNKLTIEKVIKELQQMDKYKQFADEMYAKYKELFSLEGTKRVKEFRDSLCHNLENGSERMIYCHDILVIIDNVMRILNNIYQYVFNTTNEDFYKIQHISMTLADDYWTAICEQADKQPNRHQELTELQRILNCGK